MSNDADRTGYGATGVARLMGGRSSFSALLRETEAYLELNRRICGSIPASAHGQIGVARIVDGVVVIAAASPARATQARMAAAEILAAVRSHWPSAVESTRVIVTPGIRFGS